MATTYDFTNETRTPAFGTVSNGIYVAILPWNLRFPDYTTTSIWIGTNSWIGLPTAIVSMPTSNFGANSPLGGRILLGAANNILYKLTYKILGTEPNRYAYIKYEAMLSELGSNSYASNPIVWEMSFPENKSGYKVENQFATYPEAEYLVRIISNARYGTGAPGVSGFYTPLYGTSNTDELKLDLTSNMAPGSSFKIVKGSGQYSSGFKVTSTLNTPLSTTSTLYIAGGLGEATGPFLPADITKAGTVAIHRPGAATDSISNPIFNAKDLMFHSSLPYVQIFQKVTGIGTLTFPAVARGLGTFPDPGGGGKGGKIICTKLYELGLLSEEIYLADQAFGDELVKIRPDIYNGYRAWAEIVVDWMDGQGPKMMPWMTDKEFSKAAKHWSTTWAQDIATPWAEEMAYQMGKKDFGSLTGKLITAVGIPICKAVGIWQRVFGPSKKPAGFGKGLMLIPVFIMFKLVAEIGRLIEGKK